MSKRTSPRKVVLADYKAEKADEGAIDVELPDGTTFRIPPPELWPDRVQSRIKAEKTGGEPYSIEEMAADLAGAEEFARFVEQGGTATLVMGLIKEQHNLDVGESSGS